MTAEAFMDLWTCASIATLAVIIVYLTGRLSTLLQKPSDWPGGFLRNHGNSDDGRAALRNGG
jgi:hypothetical protein